VRRVQAEIVLRVLIDDTVMARLWREARSMRATRMPRLLQAWRYAVLQARRAAIMRLRSVERVPLSSLPLFLMERGRRIRGGASSTQARECARKTRLLSARSAAGARRV